MFQLMTHLEVDLLDRILSFVAFHLAAVSSIIKKDINSLGNILSLVYHFSKCHIKENNETDSEMQHLPVSMYWL